MLSMSDETKKQTEEILKRFEIEKSSAGKEIGMQAGS